MPQIGDCAELTRVACPLAWPTCGLHVWRVSLDPTVVSGGNNLNDGKQKGVDGDSVVSLGQPQLESDLITTAACTS
eukprot:m.482213 g.482213  ORF g.482213 m.482213 type:complete len:76 (-) comp59692_c0_seq1:299-526(-)